MAPADHCVVFVLQGTELHEGEHQRQQAQLNSTLRQKEEELRILREESRVTLGHIPEDVRLDEEVNTWKCVCINRKGFFKS